ncbi:MAG: hypothetical protein K2X00_09805 [Nitrospiraceae bacterium]|nr:hypothetical protein [Nitrospiraceae bacterium]
MANTYGQKTDVAVLDTVNAGRIFGKPVYVCEIRWVNAVQAGDAVILTDGNGDPVFESVANIAHDRDRVALHRFVDDLKLPTLGSGKVYVYLGAPTHR